MSPDRLRKVEQVYSSVLKRPLAERNAFLDGACAGDGDLRREVELMLGQTSSNAATATGSSPTPIAAPTRTLVQSGTQLGPYIIEAPLGAGGMGEVFRARDTRLGRTVAIKVLPQDRVADPERKRRFLQEARTASALNHPNIVTLHDIVSGDGIDFLVMEYVPGQSLNRLITSKGLPLAEAAGYGIQIASALAAAHAAGIVHRDIKPANVIVTPESQVKILDFGLAKLTETEAPDEGLTMTGAILGTLPYMSPE